MTARARPTLNDLIAGAVNNNLRIREIICEPDGSLRLLTEAANDTVNADPLEQARARRNANKGKRHASGS